MEEKPKNFGRYLDRVLIWSKTKEGHQYWHNLRLSVDEDKNASALLDYFPNANVWHAPGQIHDDWIYIRLQFISKYWHRFNNLPSVELLKKVLDDPKP